MKRNLGLAAAALLASLAVVEKAHSQAADALIDKLVEKGILSVKEANDLREETDKGFTAAYSVKSGMPEWVNSLKFNGDFRGRIEGFNSDNAVNIDRTRYRYRIRYGVVATLKDDFEVGFRLASADTTGGFGGNPVSANTTLQGGGSRKFVFIDVAYAKWTPLHDGTWTASAMIGKMDNPFQVSSMILDADYQPEGAALQGGHNFNEKHGIKLNGAFFALNELNQATLANPSPSHDPFLVGAQLIWEAKWTKKIESTLGISAFNLANKSNLDNASVPNVNDGNTRNVLGLLVNNYNPIVGSAAVTFKLDSFPLYEGQFPIRLAGEIIKNPGAPSQNEGRWAGVMFGKAGHKGTWDLSYRYQRLEADAWYEELVDDDNGAYYQQERLGAGFSNGNNPAGAGFRGGTNVKGHLIKANYSFTDALTFTLTYYMNEVLNPSPNGSVSSANHFMADLSWKF